MFDIADPGSPTHKMCKVKLLYMNTAPIIYSSPKNAQIRTSSEIRHITRFSVLKLTDHDGGYLTFINFYMQLRMLLCVPSLPQKNPTNSPIFQNPHHQIKQFSKLNSG